MRSGGYLAAESDPELPRVFYSRSRTLPITPCFLSPCIRKQPPDFAWILDQGFSTAAPLTFGAGEFFSDVRVEGTILHAVGYLAAPLAPTY